MKRTLFSGASFLGFEASANYLGDPRFLKDQAVVEWLVKRHAKRRWWDRLFEYRWVYPGPAFVRLLTALRQTMEVLSREPVLVDTGQYQAKYKIMKYQDMENHIANLLSSLPNYQAKVRILTKEYLIKTYPAPQGLSGTALAERISFIKAQMRFLGYVRDYQEVEKEIEKRQSALRRPVRRGDLPPRHRRRRGDEGGDPPADPRLVRAGQGRAVLVCPCPLLSTWTQYDTLPLSLQLQKRRCLIEWSHEETNAGQAQETRRHTQKARGFQKGEIALPALLLLLRRAG